MKENFLNCKMNLNDGILQKFVDPKGDYNFTSRVFWSPKICLFEKCTNQRKLMDKRFHYYERVVTYDGEKYQNITEPIKGVNLPDRLEKISNSIASHVSNVTLERIKVVRMVLNFKISSNDQVIFLWCSALRIDVLLSSYFSIN